MSLTEAVIEILEKNGAPLTPQQIKEKIKERYSQYYDTEAQRRSVEKRQCASIDHALLAQIYTIVGTGSRFARDRSVKPMLISLIPDEVEGVEEDLAAGEDYESDHGTVYVLSTGVYTETGQRIVKIGQTTLPVEQRVGQLYTTGSPFKFEVLAVYKTKNYVELEQALHRLLAPFRLNKAREFFTEEAIAHVAPIVAVHRRIQDES